MFSQIQMQNLLKSITVTLVSLDKYQIVLDV